MLEIHVQTKSVAPYGYKVAKHLLLGSYLVAATNNIDMAKARCWGLLAGNEDCNGTVEGISHMGALASLHSSVVGDLAGFCLVDSSMPIGCSSESIECRPYNLWSTFRVMFSTSKRPVLVFVDVAFLNPLHKLEAAQLLGFNMLLDFTRA